ncbi:hypothetical protein LN42_01835 [Marinitoga sp. 1137]|uniref:hypothetical protein n=1 Tax=Marinitoga sp. 1137 TaxID=1545835 RepID=UPI000950B42A|nr:hypothetical protein [Marinitoga sp. 1137]APT75270.1 hypothetical protein LN42_01835 [Marinitoga sp. 1137]
MGTTRTVMISGVPIQKLIAENSNSIANAFFIKQLLERFEMYEDIEDELKEKIESWIHDSPEPYRSRFKEILQTIQKIDKPQDEITMLILFRAVQIETENRKSNGILKFFDIKGPYQKWKIREGLKRYNEEQQRLIKLPLKKENAHTKTVQAG